MLPSDVPAVVDINVAQQKADEHGSVGAHFLCIKVQCWRREQKGWRLHTMDMLCRIEAHLHATLKKVDGGHAVEADFVALLGNLVIRRGRVGQESCHGRKRR